MRRVALLLFIALAACTPRNSSDNGNDHHGPWHSGLTTSQPIPIDSANKMITSYLTSINSAGTDTNLQSLIINADTLRAYLQDTSIKNIKLMFAHTLAYTNSVNKNVYCGYSTKALTLIIVGYDINNNYVYNQQGMVYDNCTACPTHCPESGTAQINVLPLVKGHR